MAKIRKETNQVMPKTPPALPQTSGAQSVPPGQNASPSLAGVGAAPMYEQLKPVDQELGVIGLKASSGYVWEEYIPGLRSRQGAKVYQTMADSDATCGTVLQAIVSMLLSAQWTVEPVDESPAAQEAADFANSLMDDMSFTWVDTLSEILSHLTYGWSLFEVVAKRRMGPMQIDPRFRSKYEDGAIGVRKIARRAQDSLQSWALDQQGGIQGMWQLPITGGTQLVFLPIDRCLLFRTRVDKNNPEGFSILRRAYRAWWIKTTIEDYEAVGVERELAGIPVVYIPNDYLANNPSLAQAYLKIARDLRFNQQGGIVLPSDMHPTADGSPSNAPIVKIELLKSAGARTINTSEMIHRWDEAIARTMLADFLMLGSSGGRSGASGSFAMNESKITMFLKSLEYINKGIESVLNRHLLTRVWDWNGFDRALMPSFKAGDMQDTDLAKLGAFLQQAGGAGFITPDPGAEDYLRTASGLPEVGTSNDEI